MLQKKYTYTLSQLAPVLDKQSKQYDPSTIIPKRIITSRTMTNTL